MRGGQCGSCSVEEVAVMMVVVMVMMVWLVHEALKSTETQVLEQRRDLATVGGMGASKTYPHWDQGSAKRSSKGGSLSASGVERAGPLTRRTRCRGMTVIGVKKR